MLDVALALALGGDCLADVAVLRAEPGVFGQVGSDATVSRAVTALAADSPKSLRALKNARAAGRAAAWGLAGDAAPGAGGKVTAHSDKEHAEPTYKKGFGFHPLWAFADHGPDGSGEPLAVLLRPGNAGSNTAVDHINVMKDALAQLPKTVKSGRHLLIRTDGAGCTHDFLTWLTGKHRNFGYSIGFGLSAKHADAIAKIPATAWTPAYDAGGKVRDGAWVTDATGMLDLTGWPLGMRVIVRKERPHPGAQLRFTDVDGLRLTAFATNTRTGPGRQLPDLELRHRQRAPRRGPHPGCERHRPDQPAPALLRAERDLAADRVDRLRAHRLDPDARPARKREPKRVRVSVFSLAGRLIRHAGRTVLNLPERHFWEAFLAAGITASTYTQHQDDRHPPVPTSRSLRQWNRRPHRAEQITRAVSPERHNQPATGLRARNHDQRPVPCKIRAGGHARSGLTSEGPATAFVARGGGSSTPSSAGAIRSTTRSQEKLSSTRLRPASPIARAFFESVNNVSSRCSRASTSPIGTRNPVSASTMMSGTPQVGVDTVGNPNAIASSSTRPNGSK